MDILLEMKKAKQDLETLLATSPKDMDEAIIFQRTTSNISDRIMACERYIALERNIADYTLFKSSLTPEQSGVLEEPSVSV